MRAVTLKRCRAPGDWSSGDGSQKPDSMPAIRGFRRASGTRRASRSDSVVEAVTGAGKTKGGIAAAFKAVRRGFKVLVLLPTAELQTQWLRALRRDTPLTLGLMGSCGKCPHARLDTRPGGAAEGRAVSWS